ncbi:MAG: hypothetical protein PGN27_05490 [Mycolicibacterium neoaurum]|uniref:hypothetical protein n=1 Tax=Mycolicibacterium neoaurum TaxID=1795 RepID=UPI002FF6B038
MKKDRIANMVRFMAGGDTPTGPVLVGLYLIDPLTGNQTLVYDFGDVSAEVDTGPLVYECALEMAEDMLVEAGALYAVGILPLGGSFTVAAILRQRSVPDPIIYPQGATELLAGQTELPATIAETSLNHDATHCIWVSVGQTVPTTITPVTLIADFDAYSNNGNWVSPAFKNFGTGVWEIVDGALTAGGPPALFATEYKKAFVPLTRCATDNMFAEVVIGSGWSAEWNGAVVRAGVRCNAEGTAAVVMAIHQQGTGPATVTIESATNITEAGTPRATSTATFQALPSDRFRIEAVHDPELDYTTYTCLRNGEPIAGAQWPDIDNLSPRGVAWRRAMAERTRRPGTSRSSGPPRSTSSVPATCPPETTTPPLRHLGGPARYVPREIPEMGSGQRSVRHPDPAPRHPAVRQHGVVDRDIKCGRSQRL